MGLHLPDTEDSKADMKTDGHNKNKGLQESSSDGLVEPNNMVVSAPSEKNLSKLKPHGIKTTHDNKMVVEESHMVFLAVKPHIIPEVLAQLEPVESDHNPLFVSVAAGLSIARLEAMLSQVVTMPRVIRVMPNTPCMVLQGSCVYSLGSNILPPEGRMLKCLLESVGLCVEVPEYQIDAASGVAGSGPAYIYAAIEAMADGGVKMGLPRKVAMALAAQTVKGAAMMVLETGKHPAQLKDEVCSPSGTTITAMHSLEKNGLRNALISAVEAAANRSKELVVVVAYKMFKLFGVLAIFLRGFILITKLNKILELLFYFKIKPAIVF
ncbi:Pyrroline-5-carboxylate reductase 1, mitochondrial [Armadillidium nasatum]|uniref:Pyrroline-5-carboxylate reductase 3 n=1 Tax=Armadillidium nasatum TaxID=96803 RepID=A0A5N5SIV0_9CRUS|nr:Pyrroline-5-carboxylate reductase 1, mitochondrial [Armadillidium nasatum]